MKRVNMTIESSQHEKLKKLSKETGLNVSQLGRLALTKLLKQPSLFIPKVS